LTRRYLKHADGAKRVLMLVAVAVVPLVAVLALTNPRWLSSFVHSEREGQVAPRVVLSVRPISAGRVGMPGRSVFTLSNIGRVAISRLSVRARGPWQAFHVDIVDVDGIFRMDDGAGGNVGWFLFGQRVLPGGSRNPIVQVTPLLPGVHRFEFQAFDGDTPLYDASGQPATATVEFQVLQ